MLDSLSLIAMTFMGVLWTLPAFALLVFRVRLYKVTTNKDVITLTRQVADHSTVLVDGQTPSGFFLGRWFCGYIHEIYSQQGNKSSEVYVLCTKAKYANLIGQQTPKDGARGIKLWERSGNFFHLKYTPRELNLHARELKPEQAMAVEQIRSIFDQTEHATVYVHGQPGAGKSMTALLLAREMNASLCKTFNPTEPGDTLADLYARVAPTKKAPLVIVLDEVDVILRRIETGVPTVKYIPVAVKDKTSWNSFLDDIDLGMYPWIVIMMTSNKPPEWVEQELDPSYIRPGRVNLRVRLE